MTLREYSRQTGAIPNTLWKRLDRAGLKCAQDQELSDEMLDILNRVQQSKSGKSRPAPTDKPAGQQPDNSRTTEVRRMDKRPQGKPDINRLPLFFVLSFCVLASVHNQYIVASQMKASAYGAVMLTAVASLTPLLLIASRARGWAILTATAGCLIYTAWCNTVGIFSALTGYGESYTLKATPFLEAAASMAGCSYEGTAMAIGSFVAAVLAAGEVAAINELSK